MSFTGGKFDFEVFPLSICDVTTGNYAGSVTSLSAAFVLPQPIFYSKLNYVMLFLEKKVV